MPIATEASQRTDAAAIPSPRRRARVVVCGAAGSGKTTLVRQLLDEPLNRATCRFIDSGEAQPARQFPFRALTADAALIAVDARAGVGDDVRRQSYIGSLVGVRRVVLAVNKLDLMDYSQLVFQRIEREYLAYARKLGFVDVACIPVCATQGDNVGAPSMQTPWYRGPSLSEQLGAAKPDAGSPAAPFRMLVQQVAQSADGSLSCGGRIVSGTLRAGERVRAFPSGHDAAVEAIVAQDSARASISFARQLEIRPGDVLSAADAPAQVADQFEAQVFWTHDEALLPGRPYLMQIGTRTVGATVTRPKYKVKVETLEHLAAQKLERGDIGVCNLHVEAMVPFDPYEANRATGRFLLLDPDSRRPLGAGLLNFALRRSHNIHWQAIEIDKRAHAALKGQRPCVVWFTGLSGSGKSTIANVLEKKLHAIGRHTYLLDGDNVRHGLNKDLGFTEGDRVENIRRVSEVAKLMVDAGLIVLVSFISPFRSERRFARSLVQPGEFCEVFVDTPLEVAESRDRKGLYKKARRGELKNFTGIDSPYEIPEVPEIRLDTTFRSAEEAADAILDYLAASGMLQQA